MSLSKKRMEYVGTISCEAGVLVSLKGVGMKEENWVLLKIQMLKYKYTHIHIIIFQEQCFHDSFQKICVSHSHQCNLGYKQILFRYNLQADYLIR